MRPPPTSDHLSKDKHFPSQNPMITTSGKRRPPISHCDQFLAWRFNGFRVVFNLLKATTWTNYQGSFRFMGAKIWNTLPLALRSELDLNKFGFGLKRHFRSKPNWASNTFAILSCSIFYLLLCFVLFFLFISALFKPASLNWAPLTKYCSK